MSNTLPSRLSERAFRSYEDAIAIIVERWPSVTIFPPGKRAPRTFEARLRDAIASLLSYRWPTDRVDVPALVALRPELSIRLHDGKIYAGPRSVLRDIAKAKTITEPTAYTDMFSAEPVSVDVSSREDFLLLCRLAHMRAFSGPLLVRGASSPWVEEANASFDIVTTPREDGVELL